VTRRPQDYVLCSRCRRPVEKKKAHYVDGVPYGSECIKLVKRDLVKR
jgi:hypothetical protein